MQDAVDVVQTGEHLSSRVAASIFNPGCPDAAPAAVVSHRPDCLKAAFDWDFRLGASSQFIHAELAAMAAFTGTLQGAHICVTDPFCPNCAKNMAEAGVRAIYIDHKGFEKDFIARKGAEFRSMSMLIAEKAGISVYSVNRKGKTVTPILEQGTVTRPVPSAIEFFDPAPGMSLDDAMRHLAPRFGGRESWALAFIREADGAQRGFLVFEALPPGLTPEDFKARADMDTGKYRFPVDPLTRLLILARRMGFTLPEARVGCGLVPSSRAIVNALGFGVRHFVLASRQADHDTQGIDVLELLGSRAIADVSEVV